MAATGVIGDREKGNIPELLRQACKDSQIQRIIEGKVVPRKLALDHFIKILLMGCGCSEKYDIGERIMAYYREAPDPYYFGDYGGGLVVGYYAGVPENSSSKISIGFERLSDKEVFESITLPYPDGILRLKRKSLFETDIAGYEIVMALINTFKHELAEVYIPPTKSIGFFKKAPTEEDEGNFEFYNYKTEKCKYTLKKSIDLGFGQPITSVSLLEPRINMPLPEGTELSDKVKKWLQLE